MPSGKVIKSLEILSVSAEMEGKTSSVTFELTHPVAFRSRVLVFVFCSKLQLITRATILSVTKTTLKIEPIESVESFIQATTSGIIKVARIVIMQAMIGGYRIFTLKNGKKNKATKKIEVDEFD